VTGVFVSTGLVLLLIFISLLNQILTLLATPLFYQWLLRRYVDTPFAVAELSAESF